MRDRKDETDKEFDNVNDKIQQVNMRVNSNFIATARIKEELDELKPLKETY